MDVIVIPPILMKMLEMAKSIKGRNNKLSDGLDEKDASITEFRDNFEKAYEGFRNNYLKGKNKEISG